MALLKYAGAGILETSIKVLPIEIAFSNLDGVSTLPLESKVQQDLDRSFLQVLSFLRTTGVLASVLIGPLIYSAY